MNQHLNSRRSFISSMAILSTGAALQPTASLLRKPGTNDLKQQWRLFCKNNNGIADIALPLNPSMIPPCAGHFYKLGASVYFASECILAQPTWVYWGKQKNIPDDVIISIYDGKDESRFFRINRFELEGLNALRKENNSLNTFNILKEMAPAPAGKVTDKTLLKITTVIDGKQHARSMAILSTHKIAFENQLIYNA